MKDGVVEMRGFLRDRLFWGWKCWEHGLVVSDLKKLTLAFEAMSREDFMRVRTSYTILFFI